VRVFHRSSELPLLVFTTLAQFTLGVFTSIFVAAYSGFEALGWSVRFLWVAMACALLASIFHASRNRLSAYRVTLNLASSRLSREVLSAGLFLLLLAGYAYFSWFKGEGFPLHPVYDGVTLLAGFAMLAFMASAYLLPARPFWNTPYTLTLFTSSVFILGPLGAWTLYALHQFSYSQTPVLSIVSLTYCRWAALVTIIMLLIRIFHASLHVRNLKRRGVIPERFKVSLGRLPPVRTLTAAVALILAGLIFLYVGWPIRTVEGLILLVSVEFLVLLFGEVVEKAIFYRLMASPIGVVNLLSLAARLQALKQKV